MNENKYLKYNGAKVLCVVGVVMLLMTLPSAVMSLVAWLSVGSSLYLMLAFTGWADTFVIILSVYIGVRWIAHKEGAKYSLIVGFLLMYLSYMLGLLVVGQINSLILYL